MPILYAGYVNSSTVVKALKNEIQIFTRTESFIFMVRFKSASQLLNQLGMLYNSVIASRFYQRRGNPQLCRADLQSGSVSRGLLRISQ